MTRSNAREVAVHLIYEIDYTGEDPAQAIETRMDRSYYSGLSAENDVYAERPSKKQMDYIRTCVTGVCEHAEELDALIAQYAVRWNLHRISRLTKAAMRLAIYEMRYVDDVPNGVAINECVELTRKYEDAQVVSFVNGILGSVARGAKPNTEAPADPQPEEAQPEETPSEETQPAPEEAQQPWGCSPSTPATIRPRSRRSTAQKVTISRACSMWSRARSDCARVMRCSPM